MAVDPGVAYKFLVALLMPLNLVLGLGAAALVLAARGKGRPASGAGALALLLLFAISTPWLPDALASSLERRYPPVAPADSASADAIVVLGGCLAPAIFPRLSEELDEASDRMLHGARLYRAGKAPVVVLSGGNLPWSSAPRPEAESMAAFVEEWGVPRSAMIVEARSRTTRENAVESARLLRARGVRSILLVTSAMHMPRAVEAFGPTGLRVIPSPAGFGVVDSKNRPLLSWLPSSGAIGRFQGALWEEGGRLYYRYRGWSR